MSKPTLRDTLGLTRPDNQLAARRAAVAAAAQGA